LKTTIKEKQKVSSHVTLKKEQTEYYLDYTLTLRLIRISC